MIFGEIVPQSICVRYGLPIGAWMSPFVLGLMYILSPVAWPTAKLLDWLLGEDHGTTYKKAGLKTLVSLHRSMGEAGQRLHADEVTIISAVLDLKEKTIGSIMTPMDDVFTLSLDDILDESTMDDILSQGYSRVPVHHPDNDQNFVGMLLVKMLITYDPEDAKPVREFALATLPETKPETSCLDIVNFFQEGKSHMVLVSDHPGEDHGAQGVVTLEDVIEELIGEEIVDESDVFIDVHRAIRRMNPGPKTRVLRSAGEAKQIKQVAQELVDISENQTLEASDLRRLSTSEGDGPKAPSGPRRMSGNSVIVDNKTKQRANIDDVKGHLKHLGPSNLASRPKTTRYASVKIKPGTDNRTSSPQPATANGRATPMRRVSETNSEYGAGIGEGLLRSGGKEASDGVKDLIPHYGTLSQSPADRRPTSASKAVQSHGPDIDASSRTKDSGSTYRPSPQKGESQDTISPLPSGPRSKSPIQSRAPARSGSITEHVVDTNGIRKVVLETTSSSDSNDEEEANGASNKHSERTRTNEGSGSPNTHPAESEEADNNNDATASKKRRRRKKRNAQSKNDETEPLLGGKK